jgi:hypothetical protein
MSVQFCVFTSPGNYLARHFNARGMNGYRPLFPLDPSADGISYASVFHRVKVGLKSEAKQPMNFLSFMCWAAAAKMTAEPMSAGRMT